MHRLEIGGAPAKLARTPSCLLQENAHAPADAGLVEIHALAIEQRLEAGQSLGLHGLRHLTGMPAAGVPGRGEYLNEKARGITDSRIRSSVSSKSLSVSPGSRR